MGIYTEKIFSENLLIPMGKYGGITWVNKFGANAVISDGSTEEVWDGSASYVFPTSAVITSISQTTDQVAMRGANIEIQGLDSNWDLVVQTATLDSSNTTTVVTLGTALIRIFRMKVLADVVSTSTIRCHNSAETQDYAIIGTGNNQTLMAIYTIPNGYTGYIKKYYGSAIETIAAGKPDSTEFRLWVADRDNTYEFQLKHVIGLPKQSPIMEYCFTPYMKVTQKSDIKITAKPVGDSVSCQAGFDLILVKN